MDGETKIVDGETINSGRGENNREHGKWTGDYNNGRGDDK